MDNPPSNYNPNESVLSGGINSTTPITMVQGGGSSSSITGILDNYNETASVLDGGITNMNAPITQIQGGAASTDSSIQIVKNYNMLDEKQYEAFIQKFSTTGRFKPAATRLGELLKKEYNEKPLHYTKSGTYVESSSINSRNTDNLIQIKFVPPSTKSLIILPPVSDPKDFVNQLMFLINNQYLTINSKNELILERNIFVISLAPFDSSDTSIYFYYKLKLSNLYSYYRVDDPFVFIVRKEIEDKKGILIGKSEVPFLNPINKNDLMPTDYDIIIEDRIETMKYKGDPSNIYNNFYIIANGTDPDSSILNDYTFTLEKNIAILDLIDEDVEHVNVDIQGEKYRIRLPLTPNKTLDKVYNAWINKKYERDELRLIKKLHLEDIVDLDIPLFLFHLSYFKCFNDASLLTKQECTYMKKELQKVYLYSLKKHSKNISKLSTGTSDNRIIQSIQYNAIDASSDNVTPIYTVTYLDNNETKTLDVPISSKFIDKIKSDKPEDILAVKKEVETEFRK